MNRLSECVELIAFVLAACLSRRSARRADDTESELAFGYEDPMAPVTSTLDYLAGLIKGTRASPCVFTSAMVLLERAVDSGAFSLSPGNVHVLYGVALTLAIKWHEDFFFTNAFYASLCGVPLKPFNRLEREFLRALNYSVAVNEAELAAADDKAVQEACGSVYGDLLIPEMKKAGRSSWRTWSPRPPLPSAP